MQGFFDKIYSQYKVQVYFFVSKYISNREDVEDVVQEIFVHLWKYSAQLKSSDTIESIIFKSAKQEIASFYRRSKIVLSSIEEVELTLQVSESQPANSEASIELLRQELQAALKTVPYENREIFLDHKVSGKSYSTLAKEHGISKSAVEKRVNKVLTYLRSSLNYSIEEYPLILCLLVSISFVPVL